MMRLTNRIFFCFLIFLLGTDCHAQVSENFRKAQKLHHDYEFDGARRLYSSEKAVADSSQLLELDNLMMQCDNGSNMLLFAGTPTVVTSKTMAAKDFYLYYSQLKNNVWVPNPNAFSGDSTHRFCTATYFDKSKKQIYYSKPGESGSWNIYRSHLEGDTLWSVPATLSESLTSPGDEIFPLLSSDGRRLYFSSNAMAGMGGYDIFVSELCADGISWSAPVNLGFPYSSPADDFLYFDTPDGKFTMFASNRDCPKDSMTIYILAFEANPIRRSISSAAEAREIASLRPKASAQDAPAEVSPSPEVEKDEQFKDWYEARERLSTISKSYAALEEEMSRLRSSYANASPEQKAEISKNINDAEWVAMELQGKLSKAKARMGEIEAEYLAKGMELPSASIEVSEPKKLQDSETTTSDLTWSWSKNSFGKMGEVRIAEPEPEFDWTFKITDTAVIVEDNTLPDGIVFQAQLCAVSSKLSVKKFRGMSPIFEVKTKTGKYIYYAGVFNSYEEAVAAMPKIKKCGFSNAYIVAFRSGKSIEVKTARSLTKK